MDINCDAAIYTCNDISNQFFTRNVEEVQAHIQSFIVNADDDPDHLNFDISFDYDLSLVDVDSGGAGEAFVVPSYNEQGVLTYRGAIPCIKITVPEFFWTVSTILGVHACV